MERALERELQRARRCHRALSFGLLDVDAFKAVNDTLGHPAGDAMLRQLGRALQEGIRASDSAARWGGDEFAVLLPEGGFEAAKAFADRLQRLVSELPPVVSGEGMRPVTLSMGFVCVYGVCPDQAALMKWADRALYAAKAGGRDGVRFLVLGEGSAGRPEVEAAAEPAELKGGQPGDRRRR